jgi:hypothetical protein
MRSLEKKIKKNTMHTDQRQAKKPVCALAPSLKTVC